MQVTQDGSNGDSTFEMLGKWRGIVLRNAIPLWTKHGCMGGKTEEVSKLISRIVLGGAVRLFLFLFFYIF